MNTGASDAINQAVRAYPSVYSLHREDGYPVAVLATNNPAIVAQWLSEAAIHLLRIGGVVIHWRHGTPHHTHTYR